MNTFEEKISLLSEMVHFSLVDGELHENEMELLLYISEELEIEKDVFLKLFYENKKTVLIKDEFSRVLHFYQLALIMHCDNRIHINENKSINHIGIRMGLNPNSMKTVLDLMQESVDKKVPIETLISVFKNQYN